MWKPCNRCRPCLARMKRDRAARAAAQAAVSAEVVALTLTYRPGNPAHFSFWSRIARGCCIGFGRGSGAKRLCGWAIQKAGQPGAQG